MSKSFYIIAHKVNQIEDISLAIDRGANAIECDVRHHAGRGFFISHNIGDLDSVDLDDYLDALRDFYRADPRLALVIFDCKPSVAEQPDLAVSFLTTIRHRLTRGTALNILISTAAYEDREFLHALNGAPGGIRAREGVAIDEDNEPSKIARYFQSKGIQRHAYGNGTLSLGYERRTPASILEGVALKARPWGPRFVYVWTLNDKRSIRNYLRTGVDAVFVNFHGLSSRGLSNVLELLDEAEFRPRLHLAQRDHDPFAPPDSIPYVLTIETGNKANAGTDADLRFFLTGANGSLGTTISAKPPGLFEGGDRNYVTLEGADIGLLRSLTVSRNTAGNAPGWYLKAITVSSLRLDRSYRFAFDVFIPRRGATRWFGQASYRFEVKTSDVLFAGTDATVSFLLQGADANLTHEMDGDEGERFEQDRLNQFTVAGPDLGRLRSLTVSHDDSGDAADWHLAWVRVYGPNGMQQFAFDRWITMRPTTVQA